MNYTPRNPQIYSVDDRLITVIDRLTEALNVCSEVSNANYDEREADYTKQYPYATGWASSSMEEAIGELDQIVRELREDDER